MTRPAADLLVSALLALAAPPAPSEAGLWIYGEALPKGLVTGEEAGLIKRAVALSQADNLPLDLVVALKDDAAGFFPAPR